jgi:hypothetical protein
MGSIQLFLILPYESSSFYLGKGIGGTCMQSEAQAAIEVRVQVQVYR